MLSSQSKPEMEEKSKTQTETMGIKTNQMSRRKHGRADETGLRERNPRNLRAGLAHQRETE
jgi:hypothetical protein